MLKVELSTEGDSIRVAVNSRSGRVSVTALNPTVRPI
jgi:hypothetical protein